MQGFSALKTASECVSGAFFITTSGKAFTEKRRENKLKNQHFHPIFPKCVQKKRSFPKKGGQYRNNPEGNPKLLENL
jgi:hypothetical protein